MIDNKSRNLNECFVICKKYNGKLYFKGQYTRDYKEANSARIFSSKEEVEKELIRINTNRKKIKYFIEPANRHFMNNWVADFGHWNRDISFANRPISLAEAVKDNFRLKNISMIKTFMEDKIVTTFNNKKMELEKEIANLEQKLIDVKARHEQSVSSIKATLATLDGDIKYLQEFDFEGMYKKFETPLETTYRILYETKITK
jgi:hypothetical protein